MQNYGKSVFIKSIVEKDPPPLDPPLTDLVTVGTEIAAPHEQQVTVAAVQLRFHLNFSGNTIYDAITKFKKTTQNEMPLQYGYQNCKFAIIQSTVQQNIKSRLNFVLRDLNQ